MRAPGTPPHRLRAELHPTSNRKGLRWQTATKAHIGALSVSGALANRRMGAVAQVCDAWNPEGFREHLREVSNADPDLMQLLEAAIFVRSSDRSRATSADRGPVALF